LRIDEDVGRRHDNILIPASGLEEFRRVFEGMAKMPSEIPAGEISERNPQELA
jgi:hypothetical protein